MSKIDKLPKIDLTLLKKFVSQLESSLETCEEIKKDESRDPADFIIEMSKSTGLVSGLIQESTMLIGDIQSVMKVSQQQPMQQKNTDFLDKILGGLKGSGGSFN